MVKDFFHSEKGRTTTSDYFPVFGMKKTVKQESCHL